MILKPTPEALAPILDPFPIVGVIADLQLGVARVQYEEGADTTPIIGALQAAGWTVQSMSLTERSIILGGRELTPAEQAAHESDEREREYAAEIDGERAVVHRIIEDARANVNLIARTLTRLNEANLYDVEFVDTGGALVAKAALEQIHVGLAALKGVVPEPDA